MANTGIEIKSGFLSFGTEGYDQQKRKYFINDAGTILPFPKPTEELAEEHASMGLNIENPLIAYEIDDENFIGYYCRMLPTNEISLFDYQAFYTQIPTILTGIYHKQADGSFRTFGTAPLYGIVRRDYRSLKSGVWETYTSYEEIDESECHLVAMAGMSTVSTLYPLGLGLVSMIVFEEDVDVTHKVKEVKPASVWTNYNNYFSPSDYRVMAFALTKNGVSYEPELEENSNNLPTPVPNGAGGGGYSTGGGESDFVPPTPDLGACGLGFVTLYNPTVSMLQRLGGFLWSTDLLDNIEKIWQDPMDLIVTLNIVPCTPTQATTKRVYIGGLDAKVDMPVVASEYTQVDCGRVYIPKFYQGYMDYNPHTRIQMFVPFVGFVQLNTDEVMDKNVGLVYNINMLTGNAMAFITVEGDGLSNVLYQYSCNVIQTIQLSAKNFATIIANGVKTLTSTAIGGAMGGGVGSLAGGVMGAVNTALTKPEVRRGGDNNGGSGFMAHKKLPYIVIERPIQSYADKFNYYEGLPTNITANVGKCIGYIQFESVNLDGLKCHKDERDEIEQILKNGIYV